MLKGYRETAKEWGISTLHLLMLEADVPSMPYDMHMSLVQALGQPTCRACRLVSKIGRHDDALVAINRMVSLELLQQPRGFVDGDGEAKLQPGQCLVEATLMFDRKEVESSSNWTVRMVLDPEGHHWVWPCKLWGTTHRLGDKPDEYGLDEYEGADERDGLDFWFYPEWRGKAECHKLVSRLGDEGDDDDDNYTPIIRKVERQWLKAARAVYGALQDPEVQSMILAKAVERLPDLDPALLNVAAA